MRISVIIPTYNRKDFLLAALNSVFAQTRPAAEVIVIDDGSTDGTDDALAGYSHSLVYHYQNNAGQNRARNVGQGLASGEAFLFLDSDDLLFPDALAKLSAALERHRDAPLAYGRAQIIDREGNVTEPVWPAANEAERDYLWESLMSVNFIRSTGVVLLRRTALEAVGAWDESLKIEDWDLWLRLAEPPEARFARVPEPVLQYRIHGANSSQDEIVMYNGGRQLFLKHRERHAPGSPRRAAIEDFLRLHPPLAPGQSPAGSLIAPRHRILRSLMETLGLAPLYRRLPIGTRMRLRGWFGVKPWARG